LRNEEAAMLYTITIRRSTVVFDLLVLADSKKAAVRRVGKRIRNDYPGFHIYRID
jgi:hypothetical protein